MPRSSFFGGRALIRLDNSEERDERDRSSVNRPFIARKTLLEAAELCRKLHVLAGSVFKEDVTLHFRRACRIRHARSASVAGLLTQSSQIGPKGFLLERK